MKRYVIRGTKTACWKVEDLLQVYQTLKSLLPNPIINAIESGQVQFLCDAIQLNYETGQIIVDADGFVFYDSDSIVSAGAKELVAVAI